MRAVIVFLLSAIIALSYGFCNSDSKNVEVKLKNDILCHYKKDERPKQLKLPIEFNYDIIGFDFDESDSQLKVQSRILNRWDDLRLKWDESQYDSIQLIHVSSEDLWIPKFFLNDSHHHYGLGSCHEIECLIKSSGQVQCRFPCVQYVACDADYYDWPYDSHQCKAVFRTFLMMEDVEFDVDNLGGMVLRMQNNEWKLSSINGTINLNDKSTVNFVFTLERFSGTLFKHVVVPGYVLITLTLLILFIEPDNYWRIILCGVNIYLHFDLMDRIWWQFPVNGVSRNVPRILKYMIFMLILSTIILIKSIYLRVLSIRNPIPPMLIKNVVRLIESNKFLKYFIDSPMDRKYEDEEQKVEEKVEGKENADDSESDETQELKKVDDDATKDKKIWKLFYRLIDRTVFIIFVISYAVYDG